MTYVKTHLPTLKTHVVNLKRDAKDLSRDLQRLEIRGKLGSKTLYWPTADPCDLRNDLRNNCGTLFSAGQLLDYKVVNSFQVNQSLCDPFILLLVKKTWQ